MKQKIGKALDHLIYLHKIEEKRKSGAEGAKIAGVAVFLLGILVASDILLQGSQTAVAANATVGNRKLPIYCVETAEPKIALTFDAAWGNEDTGEILRILKEQEVRATFFMTGEWVTAYPEDVKAILAAGHDLGNHSQSHPNMSQLSDTEKKEEILSVHNRVKELTGYEMELFRPPYGDYDNAVVNTAEACGYFTIQWDVDTIDIKVMTI